MTCPRHAGGAALVIAMLLAALAAAVTVALATPGQERWRATVEHRRDQVQAEALAQAGVQWARAALDDDARSSSVDSLNEPWALPLPATPLENGSIEGRIVDAQGLLNLDNLSIETRTRARPRASPRSSRAAHPRCSTRSPTRSTLTTRRTGGAEDALYARRRATLRQRAALRVGEFATVRGMTPAAMAAIRPFVTALPPPTTLNVNTAPADVLAALPGLDTDGATALIAGRARKPFTTLAEFRARPAGDARRRAQPRRVEQLLPRHRRRAPGRRGACACAAAARARDADAGRLADARVAATLAHAPPADHPNAPR